MLHNNIRLTLLYGWGNNHYIKSNYQHLNNVWITCFINQIHEMFYEHCDIVDWKSFSWQHNQISIKCCCSAACWYLFYIFKLVTHVVEKVSFKIKCKSSLKDLCLQTSYWRRQTLSILMWKSIRLLFKRCKINKPRLISGL